MAGSTSFGTAERTMWKLIVLDHALRPIVGRRGEALLSLRLGAEAIGVEAGRRG